MTFKKGQSGNLSGRTKGVPNKITKIAKEVITDVAEMAGNEKGLYAWMKKDPKNEYAFWTIIYPKILAQRVDVTSGGQPLMMRIEQVIVQQGEDEAPIVEGVDYIEVPSTDPEIEAEVQRQSAPRLTHHYNSHTKLRVEDDGSYDNPGEESEENENS